MDFLPEGGTPIMTTNTVAANSPLQIHADQVTDGGATSTVVRSLDAVPLAIERTMSWNARGYGGHGGGAVSPATRWLFAEGAQGFLKTYILLANDNAKDVPVTVKFLLEGGGVVTHVVTVPARSRETIDAGSLPDVVNRSFGLDITAEAPIIAERAMYFSMGTNRPFDGGHESAGVNETSTRWFLAEGATGEFFDCFVLLSNPNNARARVKLTYLLSDGATYVQDLTMEPNSRHTINVETVAPVLANAAVSTTVTSDIGIVAERAMYWPNVAEGWREAHNSFGVTQLACVGASPMAVWVVRAATRRSSCSRIRIRTKRRCACASFRPAVRHHAHLSAAAHQPPDDSGGRYPGARGGCLRRGDPGAQLPADRRGEGALLERRGSNLGGGHERHGDATAARWLHGRADTAVSVATGRSSRTSARPTIPLPELRTERDAVRRVLVGVVGNRSSSSSSRHGVSTTNFGLTVAPSASVTVRAGSSGLPWRSGQIWYSPGGRAR